MTLFPPTPASGAGTTCAASPTTRRAPNAGCWRAAAGCRPTSSAHARPRWLATLSAGTWLTLAAWAGVPVWLGLLPTLADGLTAVNGVPFDPRRWQLLPLPLTVASAVLVGGLWLLSIEQGRTSASTADRSGRWTLRAAAFLPLVAMGGWHTAVWLPQLGLLARLDLVLVAILLICLPVPLVASRRLRGLALRLLKPSLARHCTIVGAGLSLSMLWSLVLLWAPAVIDQPSSSTLFLVLMAVEYVGLFFFYLWAGVLLLRFALAFALAGRAAKRAWAEADAAATIRGSD